MLRRCADVALPKGARIALVTNGGEAPSVQSPASWLCCSRAGVDVCSLRTAFQAAHAAGLLRRDDGLLCTLLRVALLWSSAAMTRCQIGDLGLLKLLQEAGVSTKDCTDQEYYQQLLYHERTFDASSCTLSDLVHLRGHCLPLGVGAPATTSAQHALVAHVSVSVQAFTSVYGPQSVVDMTQVAGCRVVLLRVGSACAPPALIVASAHPAVLEYAAAFWQAATPCQEKARSGSYRVLEATHWDNKQQLPALVGYDDDERLPHAWDAFAHADVEDVTQDAHFVHFVKGIHDDH
jgi:hypothetical protein